MQPLLIIGTQRSGSNMLRLMLNQLDEIAAPHPPHILQVFTPLLPKYGNLKEERNFLLLAGDICDFVAANPVIWEFTMPSAYELAERSKTKTLIGLYSAIYETYAEQHGAKMWCCKSMANLHFIPEIESSGIKPIYIHLVRDGRDVAASFKKAIVGEKHIYHLAKQWQQDQEISKQYCDQYARDRYILLSYEDLIHDTENTIKKLLDRLGLKFDRSVFEFYKTAEAKHTAEAGKMWNNLVKPVMHRNSDKFLSQLNADEILIFESIAGDTLTRFGYKLHFEKSAHIHSFSTEQVSEYDRLNKEMKDAAKALDPEGSKKRLAQQTIIDKIKSR